MRNLLERQTASLSERLILLAPPDTAIPELFGAVDCNSSDHRRFVRQMQRLRGGVYFQDGAISRADLSSEGCHETPEDSKSWHILLRDREDERKLSACIWYLEYDRLPAFQQLRVRHSGLARDGKWQDQLRRAIAAEVALAKLESVRFSEVGGWAVSEAARATADGVMMILATFSLSRMLGGALGLATATVRHSSASMLQRLGLSRLSDIPAYFDDRYACDMELLRFDTRRSSSRYHEFIERLKTELASVRLIVPSAATNRTDAEPAPELVRISGERLAEATVTAAA
jgi:hypothetical protein